MNCPKARSKLRLLACCVCHGATLASFGLVAATARAQEDAAIWQYYPPLKLSPRAGNAANSPLHAVPAQEATENPADEYIPEESAESRQGRAIASHEDRLFDSETRPSWRPPEITKPMISRPSYDYPSYDAPMYRLEPVQKVAIDRPAYVAPDPGIKPSYTMAYEQGPAEIAPTLAAPAYEGPNYDIKPYDLPAYNPPTVDRSGIDYHPEEYKPPVYQPDEYRPPRELPPSYMPPPQE
jgi:hypothetical protein